MLEGTLGSNLLGNLLTGKEGTKAGEGTIRPGEQSIATSQGQGTIRAG